MSHQTAAELNAKFAIQDHLSFHDHLVGSGAASGLVEMRVVSPLAEATIFTQGAHLTRWIPAGEQPAIYLSPKSAFVPGKAIRGGIPVLFPWFADGWDGQHKPMHGFARSSEWAVESTHLAPTGEVQVTLSLGPDDDTRRVGYDHFHVAIQFRIGRELDITMEVTNHGSEPIVFEEGLHTYLAVGDIHQVATEGLEGTTYIDKRDNNLRKVQREDLLRYTRDVDRIYVQTAEPLVVHDPVWHREIHLRKAGSNTTVTWNPWSVLTPDLPDLSEDAWQHFVCLETLNAGEDRITLAPGLTHRMDSRLSLVRKG